MHRPASGVLLINLGTPEVPHRCGALGAFAAISAISAWWRFRSGWQPILRGIIQNGRRNRQKYRRSNQDGSPLNRFTAKLARQVQGFWGSSRRQPVYVDYAMRYGQPSVGSAVMMPQGPGLPGRFWRCRCIRNIPPATASALWTSCIACF